MLLVLAILASALALVASLPFQATALPTPTLANRAYKPLPLGSVAPGGWLLEQMLTQANSLSGVMSKSSFPGA